jgi:hypothetical protein
LARWLVTRRRQQIRVRGKVQGRHRQVDIQAPACTDRDLLAVLNAAERLVSTLALDRHDP